MGLFFRFFTAFLLGLAGWHWGRMLPLEWRILPILGGGLLGSLVAPYITIKPLRYMEKKIAEMPTATLVAGIIGLLIALLVTAFLTLPLSLLPGAYGRVVPMVLSIFLCYGIITLTLKRSKEIFRFLGISSPENKTLPPILMDTSTLIDGRVVEVAGAGFIPGQLVIPDFVLKELQKVADSTDHIKRRRGARGLEMLERLQKESALPVKIEEIKQDENLDVDTALVKLAQKWKCALLTTDFNLNRIAEIQGVKVLNLNTLSHTLRKVFLPGEEIEIEVVREGKEAGQGIGYLDDGTMVVVEGGKKWLHSKLTVVVSKTLDLPSGRMLFAHIKK